MPCVETGARIHLGFYSVGRGSWGALALYIDEPGFLVCSPPLRGEEWGWISGYLERSGVKARYSVERGIPRHVGLGSTTQGVLAAAHAIALSRGRCFDPAEEAARMGLGRISGTGVLTYMYGGLVVGLGRDEEGRHRLLVRMDFPSRWRVILVLPEDMRGLSEEQEAFMAGMEAPGEVLRGGMAEAAWAILRGVASEDLGLLTRGVELMEEKVGEYFARYQGGRYRSELLSLVERLRDRGIVVGQSSWGPLLYSFARETDAGRVASIVGEEASRLGLRAKVWVARPRNRPAGPVPAAPIRRQDLHVSSTHR